MVKCVFVKGNHGYVSMKISDHAKDSKVCAAVSAVGMTLSGAIREVDGIDIVENYFSSGYISVIINPFIDSMRRLEVDTIFSTVFIGLKQLEATYIDEIDVMVIQ